MTRKRRDGGGKRRGTSSQPASLEAIMEVVQEGPGVHDSVAGTGAPGVHTRLHRSFQQACHGLAVHVRGCASEGGSSF